MATPKRKNPNHLTVVGADLEAMERVVKEAAEQTAPMTARATAVRNEQTKRLNDLTRERNDFTDRKELLTAQYQAAVNGLDEHIRDIDEARRVLVEGVGEEPPAAAE